MARVEGYRCPITMRTTTIQPYDVPRFVSDIISQLHEIGHWTTRCCAVLNHTTPSATVPVISSTITPRESRVSTTLLTEMDLIKRNLNVVEKQHNTRLMSEIAYLQCALRSEAEEKMTDFESYVEAKINQCIDEHTKKVRQDQVETSIALSAMQDHWMSLQTDVSALTQQIHKVQTTMEMTANRTVEMMASLHEQLKESSKLRDKHELNLGNQLTQVKLQLHESNMGCKTSVDQLTARVDIIRSEVKFAIDQLKMQIQQHARALNRVSKGSNLFEMMTPVAASPDIANPQHTKIDHDPSRASPTRLSKNRPMSARPTSSQPTHVQPALSTNAFVFAENIPILQATTEPSKFDIQGKTCPVAHPLACDIVLDAGLPLREGGNNNFSTHTSDNASAHIRPSDRTTTRRRLLNRRHLLCIRVLSASSASKSRMHRCCATRTSRQRCSMQNQPNPSL
ncbi:hypothetical protein, variant [Aphanomyces invadans]|uniref:Uncharacterized protein n=1 Tax=Aphanomyces invadans TaxID=157072 RepID=A0A024UQ89_9STRA|nr:hypothetical protein, variant [Aphanomyces invadans]ETW08611.1 hypothetical protein, variant [Aphanomyces invadans]|eukprot:XP_008862416.1 hypothetical protein, variant [Aphanomyces invadans]